VFGFEEGDFGERKCVRELVKTEIDLTEIFRFDDYF